MIFVFVRDIFVDNANMSYFYAFKNRIDFAGSGLSEVKKSDIDIAVNIAGEVYSAYRRVMYENSEPGGMFCNFVADRLA